VTIVSIKYFVTDHLIKDSGSGWMSSNNSMNM